MFIFMLFVLLNIIFCEENITKIYKHELRKK